MFGEWKRNWWFFAHCIYGKGNYTKFLRWFTHSEFIQTQCKMYFSISCLYSNTEVSTTKISWYPSDCLIISQKIISKCDKDIIHFLTPTKFTSSFTLSTLSLHITTLQGQIKVLWSLRFIWLRRMLFKEKTINYKYNIRWKNTFEWGASRI